jgi:hypothetical protein
LLPSTRKIEVGGFRGYGGNSEDRDEEQNGNDTEQTFITDCYKRRNGVAAHDFLFDDKLCRGAKKRHLNNTFQEAEDIVLTYKTCANRMKKTPGSYLAFEDKKTCRKGKLAD